MHGVRQNPQIAGQHASDRITGRPGKQSAAARFASATIKGFTIEDETPYSEVCSNVH